MKMLNKLALFVMVLLLSVVSIPATQVSAATSDTDPVELEMIQSENEINYYYTYENGEKVLVYCFNSELHWPYDNINEHMPIFTRTEFNHLDDETKLLLYRVFYAGYPHNNAGLYEEGEDPWPTEEMINEALQTDATLISIFPELNGLTLTYHDDGTGNIQDLTIISQDFETGEEVVEGSPEALAMKKVSEKIEALAYSADPDEYALAKQLRKDHPRFYTIAIAYSSALMYDSIEALSYFYKDALPPLGTTMSADQAHRATQYAIWVILNQQGVDGNRKDFYDLLTGETEHHKESLVKKLVDFARGTDPVPPYENTFDKMEEYKTSFNNKEHLLNADGKNVGQTGGIRFTKNPFDGKYYSEKLHFSQETDNKTYSSAFNISVINGMTELSTMTTYGKDEFVIVSDEMPTGAKVKLESTNYWPSPIFQYSTDETIDEVEPIQEMSGVYYKQVDLGFEVPAIIEEGTLVVKKFVDGAYTDIESNQEFWFKASIEIKDANGEYLSGNLPFEKYKLDIRDEIDSSKKVTGTIDNTGDPATSGYNMKFSIKAGEAIVFPDLPLGTKYSIEEYALSEDGTMLGNWTPTYTVDGETGHSGTLTAKDTIVVTNTYTYPETKVIISGTKQLKTTEETPVNMGFGAEVFEFVIRPNQPSNPMPAGTTTNTTTGLSEFVTKNTVSDETTKIGTFSFPEISFTKPGNYSYTIEEISASMADVSLDPNHYVVNIVVTEDPANPGTLKSEVSYEKHDSSHASSTATSVDFVNSYDEHELDEELKVIKKFKNNSSDAEHTVAGYVFEIKPIETTTIPVADYPVFGTTTSSQIDVTTGVSGEAVTPAIKITKSWFDAHLVTGEDHVELKYEIKETGGPVANGTNGVTYDNSVYTATILVHKGTDGKYDATITYTDKDGVNNTEAAVFTNQYSATGTALISVDKTITSLLDYKPATEETYEVSVSHVGSSSDGYNIPTGNIKMVYDGTKFSSTGKVITFTKAGDYVFELKEVVGTTSGIEYDANRWHVEVKVVDDGVGTLTATNKYFSESDPLTPIEGTDAKATFTNVYADVLKVPAIVKKTLVGRPLESSESFEVLIVEADPTNPLTEKTTASEGFFHHTSVTLNSMGDFKKETDGIAEIHKPGTYYLKLNEVVPATATMSYDKSTYVIKMVVAQEGNKLELDDGKAVFYRIKEGKSWDEREKLDSSVCEFVNKAADLLVKKTVVGLADSEEYGFKLTLLNGDDAISNTELKAIVDGVHTTVTTDSKGEISFELKKDQSIRIIDLPDGTKYTVEETKSPTCDTEISVSEDGTEAKKVTSKKVDDELVAGVKEEVLVLNKAKHSDTPEYPKVVDTGDNSRTGAYMALAGLSAIGVALVSLTINKLEKN